MGAGGEGRAVTARLPHPRERLLTLHTGIEGVTRVSRGFLRRLSRDAPSRRREPSLAEGSSAEADALRWRPGEAWSEGRWRARRREAGVHETRSEVGRERARRSKIDRRVAWRSGGETRPNRARLRACRQLAALARISPPPKIAARCASSPTRLLPFPPPAATVASLSGCPRAAS